jgi:hypothetical protein
MAISLNNNTPRDSYTVTSGNTQSLFNVTFSFFDQEDLDVYLNGVQISLGADFTVAGGDGSTGTISTVAPVAPVGTNSTVVITRDIPLQRTTDFPLSGVFNIEALNTELDRLIAIAGDLSDASTRSIKLNPADPDATLNLPVVSSRAGNVLGFDADGDAIAGPAITTLNNVVANQTAANTAATNAATSAANALASETNAANSATTAANTLSAANLPTNFVGEAGKVLEVNSAETGYQLATSAQNNGVFYGLYVDGSTGTLKVDHSELGVAGSFDINNYDNYFFSSPNVTFTISSSGVLQINTP